MIDPAQIPIASLLRTFRRESERFRSGCYHQLTPSTGLTTDATLGWQVVRVMPIIVPNRCTINTLGAEVTAAGAAGSVFRMGIWTDAGGFPGSLLLDAGTIDGTSATVQTVSVTQALKPGLYWGGGALQGGTSGTQPTFRTLSGITGMRTMITNGATPVAGQTAGQGFSYSGVSGALPSWTATVSPTVTCIRLFAKVA